MNQLITRMIRAARLDVDLYEEVEADKSALTQSMAVVLLSTVAAGIGNMNDGGFPALIGISIAALVGWYLWALVTYFVGVKLMPEKETKSDVGELLRTIGFSASPGIIRIFAVIPFLGSVVNLAAGIWMIVAMVIAVRQALDYKSTGRAVAVCLIGWAIQMSVIFAIAFLMVGVNV